MLKYFSFYTLVQSTETCQFSIHYFKTLFFYLIFFSTGIESRALMFKESALPLSYIPRPLKNYFEKNNIFIWGQNKGFSVFDTESNYIAQTSGSQALDF